MANVRWFDEGLRALDDSGWPANVYVALSTKTCDQFGDSNTLVTAGMLSEITGTGVDRHSLAKPSSTGRGQRVWTPAADWATGAATNWQNPCSFVVVSVSTGTAGIAYFVANLNDGGAAVTMNQANVTLTVPITTNYPATA